MTNFTTAWASPTPDFDGGLDQGVVDSGVSRLANWYVTGIQWLASRQPAQIATDGIYLDGIGHDRTTMKRSRKVLDSVPGKPRGLIDHHCGQMFDPNYGNFRPSARPCMH